MLFFPCNIPTSAKLGPSYHAAQKINQQRGDEVRHSLHQHLTRAIKKNCIKFFCLEFNAFSFQSELASIERQLEQLSAAESRYVELKDQKNIKENEIKMLQQKLSGSSHGQLLKEIENLQAAKGVKHLPCLSCQTVFFLLKEFLELLLFKVFCSVDFTCCVIDCSRRLFLQFVWK